MKAIVWQGPERMTIEERPEPPDPGPGELILRPEAVGICGSEVEGYLGHMGNRTPPLVMGHEFAGRGRRGGRRAPRSWTGARVAVNPLESAAATCRLCRAGHANLCRDRVLIGVHVAGRVRRLRARAGRRRAACCPTACPSRVGALMEPLANGVHAVRLGARPGVERAVVLGAGTIGLVTLQAALLAGIPHVAVVEPQDAAARAGARARRRRRLRRRPRRPSAGDARTSCSTRSARRRRARSASSCCGRAGRMVCIGLAADDTTLGFHDVVRSQHRIQGSYAYTMDDFEQAHEWLVSGQASLGDDLARRAAARGRAGAVRAARRRARRRPSSRSSSPARAGTRREPLDGRRRRRVLSGIGLATARAFADAGDSVHAARAGATDRRAPASRGRTGSTSPTAPRSTRSPRASTARRRADRRRRRRTSRERRLHELTPESWDRLIGDEPHRPVQRRCTRSSTALRDGARRRRADRQRVRALAPTAPAPAYQARQGGRCWRSRAAPASRSTATVRCHDDPARASSTRRSSTTARSRPDAELRAQMLHARGRRRGVPVRRRPAAARATSRS